MKPYVRKIAITILTLVIIVGILIFFSGTLSNLNQDQAAKDKRQLEEVLIKAAVSCYATEGIYPPNFEYLLEHYGVQINEDLYIVKYEYLASNLMPDITVLETQP